MCIMMQKEKTEHFPDYQNGTVVLKSDGVEFTVEGYFCPALAKAVMTMKKGENVILTVKPEYAFGENGRPASGDEGAVPRNASLQKPRIRRFSRRP
ncbi:hypothetical protein AAHE18_05G211000 [Arachis hypogaea]